LTPATTSIEKRMARNTRSVPRSGWSMISPIGMPAMTKIPINLGVRSSPSSSARPAPRPDQAANAARDTMRAILEISDGWSWNDPSGNQAW
jgi:hypothetical protein